MSLNPFTWAENFKYEDYKKNIIEDDIIPDDLFQGIKDKIDSFCSANYVSHNSGKNAGKTTSCNHCSDTVCGCKEITYCYPANCSNHGGLTNCPCN